MFWLRVVMLRMRELFAKPRLEAELDEELQAHLEMLLEENIQRGMSAEKARRAAKIALGGAEQIKEAVREHRGVPLLESLVADIHFGLRMLRKSPGFTTVAVLTLALGIGANTAVFSVVNAVLLRPLPAPEPDRIVAFIDSTKGGPSPLASDIEFNLWRKENSAFEDVSGYDPSFYYLTNVDEPERLYGMLVTQSYFRLFGLGIAHGRSFTAKEEEGTGRLFETGHVAVISNDFWQRTFGGDPRMLGKVIHLSGNPYEIVGIMAPGVRVDGPEQPDVWTPFPISPDSKVQVHYFYAAGRLKPGVTLQGADSELGGMTQEFRREYPDTVSAKRGDAYRVERLQDVLVKDVRVSLLVLLAAVGFVLLIACANAANLLFARAVSRSRELAIRTALGATRGRIIRQLLAESVPISTAAALLGLGIGLAGIHLLLRLVPVSIPRIGANGLNVALDWRVLSFTILIAVAIGVVFGSFPAFSVSRNNAVEGLVERTGWTYGPAQLKARSAIVISEIGLSLVLVIAAILLTRTLVDLRRVDAGFDPHDVLTTRTPLDPKLLRFVGVNQATQNALRTLDNMPGVMGSAFTTILPLDGNFNSLPISVAGESDNSSQGFGARVFVSPEYFKVLKIQIVRGRAFTDADSLGTLPVAIVNRELARKLWPDGGALGAEITIAKGLGPGLREPVRQVVGIIGDVRNNSLGLPPQPSVFIPAAQRTESLWTGSDVTWVVRTRAQSPSLNTAVQKVLRNVTGLPVPPFHPMEQTVTQSTDRQTFNMLLMSIFAGAAVLLAAIGIYGVMTHLVVQKTHEIGIRMALGARQSDVMRMVLGNGAKLAVVGIGFGTVASFWLTRFLSRMLFGVRATDPMIFTLVPLGLFGIALLACWIPARRAMRVDPMVALRHE